MKPLKTTVASVTSMLHKRTVLLDNDRVSIRIPGQGKRYSGLKTISKISCYKLIATDN